MYLILFVFWHMQLYMSWYIRSFFGFTFLNILYFFKYSCTYIFHGRSLYTFYAYIDIYRYIWSNSHVIEHDIQYIDIKYHTIIQILIPSITHNILDIRCQRPISVKTYFHQDLFPSYLFFRRQFRAIVIFRLESIYLDSGSLPSFLVNWYTQH